MLNIVFDLSRRSANPFSYLRNVSRLFGSAKSLGLKPNAIGLVAQENPMEAILADYGLSRSLLVELSKPGSWSPAAKALGNRATLVLPAGCYVSPEWLFRALNVLRELRGRSLIHPEVGLFATEGRYAYVDFNEGEAERPMFLGDSYLPPVVLGGGAAVAMALESGTIGPYPSCRERWLEAYLEQEQVARRCLARSIFYMDGPGEPAAGSVLRQSPGRSVAETPWLRDALAELREVDPRIPSGRSVHERLHSIALSVEARIGISDLQAAMPENARRFFVAERLDDSPFGKVQRLLIRSIAQSDPSRKVYVLVIDSNDSSEETGRDGSIAYMGIGKALGRFDLATQARILVGLLASREPELVHLFESNLAMEMALTCGPAGFPRCELKCTILPKSGWRSGVEDRLFWPENQAKAAGTRFLFFSDGNPVLPCLKTYRHIQPALVDPCAPAEWRKATLK